MKAIDPEIRRRAAVNLLGFGREYGRQSFLSQRLSVSSRWLGELSRRLQKAIEPRPAGRPRKPRGAPEVPAPTECCCGRRCPSDPERERRKKAVALQLSVCPCSLRDTSDVLELAFGEKVSRQWISDLIDEAGTKAGAILEALPLREGIVQAAADEIFAGRKPILTVVEPRSLALLDAVRCDTRRGEDWEKILSRYPQLQRIASDCGSGLLAAIEKLGLLHQPDIFHGLRELRSSLRRLEALAYDAVEDEYAALRSLERRRREMRDLRGAAGAHGRARRKAQEAIRRYDLAAWLAQEIYIALSVPPQVTEEHLAHAAETIQTAVALLKELGVPRLRKIQTYFQPEKVLGFLKWALSHPDQWVMRASSCVEAVNSFLRVDQTVKKHLAQAYLDLLRWFYDMRPFSTGKRKGRSPLELLGIAVPYRSWLDPLLN